MFRSPVESTAIASLGYDAGARTLEVEFTSGAVYQYFDVPEVEYRKLLAAESIGEYLNRQIKPKYRSTQVE